MPDQSFLRSPLLAGAPAQSAGLAIAGRPQRLAMVVPELDSIYLMDDDMEVLPLEPKLAPSRAPPPFGEGAIL